MNQGIKQRMLKMASNVSAPDGKFLMPTLNYSTIIIQTASAGINGTEANSKLIPERNTPEGSAATISICSVALLLNLIEIGVLLRKIKRITIFEIWLLNLATADEIVSIFMVFLESIRLVKGEEKLGKELTSVRQATETIVHFSVFSSSCTLLVIAVDRFAAIKFPFKHRLLATKKKAVTIMLITWFVNVIVSLLELFAKDKAFQILDGSVIILMSLFYLATYLLIIYSTVARRYTTQTKQSRGVDRGTNEVEVIATCVLVVISYQICMLPYAVVALSSHWRNMPVHVFLMLYCNSVTNPLVYFFKGILGRKLKQKKVSGGKSKDVTSNTGSSQLAWQQTNEAGQSRL